MRASLLTAVKSTTRLTTVLVGPKCPAVVKSAEAEAEPTISIFELSDKHQAKLDLIADDLILYGDAGFTNDRLGKPSWSLRRADRLVRWLASLLRSKARDRSASPAVGRNAPMLARVPLCDATKFNQFGLGRFQGQAEPSRLLSTCGTRRASARYWKHITKSSIYRTKSLVWAP